MSKDALLIRDALVVSNDPDRSLPFIGWVRVEGNRIVEVGEGQQIGAAGAKVIDGAGHALLPGLVNAHAHSHSSLTRGSAERLRLGEWITEIEHEQARLDEDQAYWAGLATYGEALLSGTTSLVDMCVIPEAARRAAEKIGIRAVIAPYVADSKSFAPTLARVEGLLEAGPTAGGRVTTWVGLHDLESCSDAQIGAGAALAGAHGTGLHLHCAETRSAVAATRDRTGRSPVGQLAALGALGPRSLLAHCVWVDDDDLRLLAETGAHVVHCPHANLKLGSGIAPVPALVDAGINVALGTDGAKANNRLDMFDVMKFASLLHKGIATDPSILPAPHVLAMASQGGASALCQDAGAIAPGLLADLVLVRLDRLHLQPAVPETIVTNLVHAARGSDVDTVIVDGQVVVEGGALTMADQRAIFDRLGKIGRQLLSERANSGV